MFQNIWVYLISLIFPRYNLVELYGKDYRKHPIGTGPFKLKMWKEGVKLVLTKNENYF
jgi:oligopeptide transport system substrate-binding protein